MDRTLSAIPEAYVAMPTTKVGNPRPAAEATAATAAAESSLFGWAVVRQFGSPSVARRMNLGLLSLSVARTSAATVSAARVGVRLPLARPPFAVVRPAIAAAVAAACAGPTGTATFEPTPQRASVSAKNFRPQLTLDSVAATIW